jgi:hypothetical protein
MPFRRACLRSVLLLLPALVAAAGGGAAAASASSASLTDSDARERLKASSLGAPLRFEPNRGQTDPQVRYLARGTGYGLFLTDEEAVMRFSPDAAHGGATSEPAQAAVLRMRLEDAAPVRPRARLPQAGRSSYLSLDGSRPPIADLPHYSELVYRDRYPGIDVVYYGHEGQLEYDFVLAPHADPRRIALRFEGADALRVDAGGDLLIELDGRTLVQRAPIAFQYGDLALAATPDATRLRHSGAARIPVPAHYVLDGDGRVRFELGAYDRSRPLVIDPVFAYSTCLGGSGYDGAEDIALGPNGEVYVAGGSDSPDFPLAGPIHGYGGGTEIFVTKLDPSGSGAIYSTYAGGNGDNQWAYSVAVNAAGEAFVAGSTQSTATTQIRAFVMKLNAAGNAAVFSNVFGGNGTSLAYGIALDGSGNAVVAGMTSSADFPVLNALQGAAGGGYDAFVRRYSSTGTVLSSSYLGGANDQVANAVAVGPGNAIYLGGRTHVSDAAGNAFVIKLNAAASAVSYSRALGGAGRDDGMEVEVDAGSRAYLVGTTQSSDYPVVNALDGSYGGSDDGFLSILNATGATVFSTFLGDAAQESADSVALGPAGDVYVTGSKFSSNGDKAPYLVKIGPAFNTVGYSTRIGATSYHVYPRAVRVDAAGAAYVAGHTLALHPTTPGAFQGCLIGSYANAFVSKIVEGTPNMRVSDVSLAEGASGQQSAEFRVTLDAYPVTNVSFSAATTDGTATADSDYYSYGQGGTIYAGSAQANAYVIVNGDTLNEADETFTLTVGNPTGATLADGLGVATIVNDDPLPVISLSGCSVTEGSGIDRTCAFTLNLSAPSGRAVSVNLATAAGSAGAADYYHFEALTLTLQPGETSKSIGVSVSGDALDEFDETFQLTLSSPQNATLGTTGATGTIADDDAPPSLAIDNGGCAVTEGHAGSIDCVFNARLSAPSGKPVNFTSATADGSAGGADYAGHGATARSIPAGQTVVAISVPVLGDGLDEDDESFALHLGNVANATPGALAAVGSVIDDDLAPELHVDDGGCIAAEGNAGAASSCNFVARLTAASGKPVSFTTATLDGDALSGSDYSGHGATARSIPAGQTSVTIAVPVLGDTLDEDNESFTLSLTGIGNATPASFAVTGTLVDDDATPSLGIDNGGCSRSEGNAGPANCSFVVRLSAASGKPVTFTSATGGNSATAGVDFGAHAVTPRAIPAGLTSLAIDVPVLGDTMDEPDETFFLSLASVANATPGGLSATGTILDDDAAPALSVDNGGCAVNEGNSGVSYCSFVVRLSAVSGKQVSFDSATANGSAVAGSDYTGHGAAGRLIPAGTQSITLTVPVIGDILDEPNETFTLALSGISEATPASLGATGTIVDDDDAPPMPGVLALDKSAYEILESEGQLSIVVRRSGGSDGVVSVPYSTTQGSAHAGTDFAAASGTLSFSPGVTARQVVVGVIDDGTDEDLESFTFVLGTPAGGATLGAPASATITLLDDDAPPALSIVGGGCTVAEGNAGSSPCAFVFRLSHPSVRDVTFTTTTADVSATSAIDYAGHAATTRTIPANTTELTIPVAVLGDTADEPDETFRLDVSAVQQAVGSGLSGLGRVLDDDGAPALSVLDASVIEGDAGSRALAFQLVLQPAAGQTVTAQWATAAGTASAGSDFQSAGGSVVFQPGQTAREVTVLVQGDTRVEGDESFGLQLSQPQNAQIADATGTGTILDDDVPEGAVRVFRDGFETPY